MQRRSAVQFLIPDFAAGGLVVSIFVAIIIAISTDNVSLRIAMLSALIVMYIIFALGMGIYSEPVAPPTNPSSNLTHSSMTDPVFTGAIILIAVLATTIAFVGAVTSIKIRGETDISAIGTLIGGTSQFVAIIWLVIASYYQHYLLRMQSAVTQAQLLEMQSQHRATEGTAYAQELSSIVTMHERIRSALIIKNLKHAAGQLTPDTALPDDNAFLYVVITEKSLLSAIKTSIATRANPTVTSYVRSFVTQYGVLYNLSANYGNSSIPASMILEASDVFPVYVALKEIVDTDSTDSIQYLAS